MVAAPTGPTKKLGSSCFLSSSKTLGFFFVICAFIASSEATAASPISTSVLSPPTSNSAPTIHLCASQMNTKNGKPKEHDVFKDTGLRYLGYANELGESFRPLISRFVYRGSYVVAGTYVLADSVDKTVKAFNNHKAKKNKLVDAMDKGADTLVWQGLASVAIPGFVINRVVWAAQKVKWPGPMKALAPTIVGLSSIPFIVTPIDEGVHQLMDNTLRPAMHRLTAPFHED